jgi:hypothetical protein
VVGRSAKIPFDKATISAACALLVLVNLVLAYLQREGLRAEWKQRKKYFLVVEALALASFVLFLTSSAWGILICGIPTKAEKMPDGLFLISTPYAQYDLPPLRPLFVRLGTSILLLWLCVERCAGSSGSGSHPSVAYNLILPRFSASWPSVRFLSGWKPVCPRTR